MQTPVGQVINNRYRIARLIGRGGMSIVYRAWDISLNIPVALKEMIPEPGLDYHALAQLRVQFQREAQTLAGLAHPSLPRVSDFFEWEGKSYLVMDFVEGESLDQRIARQGALPEAQVVNWGTQLLDALAMCHERNVIHRDIKPQNIIIRPDGRAVLVDFGLVKLWDPRHPQTQRIVRGMGTMEYASPEHFGLNKQHTEPRSDIYSLGATLYHALAGQEPPSATERLATSVAPIPLHNLNLNVRPHVEDAILRAMAFKPAERFSSARAMRAALLASPARVVHRIERHPPVPAPSPRVITAATPLPRDTRWQLEMTTGTVMALAGVMTIQIALFSHWMTLDLYLGRGIFALLLGALGWFLGDLVFQALAQTEQVATNIGANRPTQRLVALTRRMARRLTTAQQIILLIVLLVCAVALVWVLGPVIANIHFVAAYVQFYALIGPLTYAAVGRRPGRALVAHTLVTTIAGAVLGIRIEVAQNFGALFLASLGGGLLMEGIAFLSERLIIRRQM